jgi:Protein of unknown function (DUF2917)
MPNTTRSTATWQPGAPHPARLGRAPTLVALAPAEELVLGADGVRSVHVGRMPLTFTVLEGEVLVTAAGDYEDHVVGRGQTFRTERRGHHVIAGLRPSRVRIVPA